MIWALGAIGVLLILVFIHELGHLFMALATRTLVKGFSIGFPPTVANARVGEVEYRIGLLPLGGYVSFINSQAELEDHIARLHALGMPLNKLQTVTDPNRMLMNQSGLVQFAVAAAGPLATLVGAVVIAFSLALIQGAQFPTSPVVVDRVLSEQAIIAGLHSGDTIVSLGGKEIVTLPELRSALLASQCDTVLLAVARVGERVTLRVPLDNKSGEALLGITAKTYRETLGPVEAALYGLYGTYFAIRGYIESLFQLFQSQNPTEQLSGPIGIVKTGGELIEQGGIKSALNFAFFISIALFVFNLLPFPILDGGHMVFAIYRMIAGRNIPMRLRMALNLVALAGFLWVLAWVTVGDLL